MNQTPNITQEQLETYKKTVRDVYPKATVKLVYSYYRIVNPGWVGLAEDLSGLELTPAVAWRAAAELIEARR